MAVNYILNVTQTSSNDGAGSGKANGNDGNTGSTWATSSSAFAPQWWYGDVGAGVTKKLAKVRINKYVDGNGGMLRNAKIQGSNDASAWTDLITITDAANTAEWQEWTTTPGTAYRYFRVYISSTWRSDGYVGFNEVEMYEADSLFLKSIIKLQAVNRAATY